MSFDLHSMTIRESARQTRRELARAYAQLVEVSLPCWLIWRNCAGLPGCFAIRHMYYRNKDWLTLEVWPRNPMPRCSKITSEVPLVLVRFGLMRSCVSSGALLAAAVRPYLGIICIIDSLHYYLSADIAFRYHVAPLLPRPSSRPVQTASVSLSR